MRYFRWGWESCFCLHVPGECGKHVWFCKPRDCPGPWCYYIQAMLAAVLVHCQLQHALMEGYSFS